MFNPFRLIFRPRSIRRDFAGSPSRAANPFFRASPPRWSGWLAAFLLALVGASAYIMWSPKFRISVVNVEGTEKLNPESIQRFVTARLDETFLGVTWKRVSYLVPLTALTKELQMAITKLMSVETLSIERQGRNALIVRLQERSPNLVWQSGEQTFYTLDENGVIVERLHGNIPEGFPTVVDANDLVPVIGSTVLKSRTISALYLLRERLPTLGLEVASYATWPVECPVRLPDQRETPTNASVPTNNANTNSANTNRRTENVNARKSTVDIDTPICDRRALAINEPTLVVRTSEGWDIRFDASFDLELQMQKLSLTLKERLQQRKNLKYIDVRFGDRVFFQ